jgi:pimeloyl-ACP methyl ester carboxylesterase
MARTSTEDQTETLPGPPPCVVHHRYAEVSRGVRLHYVEAAPQAATEKGIARVCCALHGFPEFWYSWRHQLPALAAAGFHALAPDLRGYNLSSKPPGVRFYRVEALVGDVLGLIRHTGRERAVVVGHDWGGVLAWFLAALHPGAVERLVILNAPHPAAFFREVRTPAQLARSWYVFFFQLPVLPELMMRAGDYALLERMLSRQPRRPGSFTPEDIRLYKQALGRPGALTAAINYYRAALRRSPRPDPRVLQPLRVPTLVVWGERDAYLNPRLLDGLDRWVPGVRVERLPGVSHWVQNDAPEPVNRLLLEFLTAGPEAPPPG